MCILLEVNTKFRLCCACATCLTPVRCGIILAIRLVYADCGVRFERQTKRREFVGVRAFVERSRPRSTLALVNFFVSRLCAVLSRLRCAARLVARRSPSSAGEARDEITTTRSRTNVVNRGRS